MCANTLCPFSSCTRNIAFGSGSVTVPSTSMASFFGKLRVFLAHAHTPTRAQASQNRPRTGAGGQYRARPPKPSMTSKDGRLPADSGRDGRPQPADEPPLEPEGDGAFCVELTRPRCPSALDGAPLAGPDDRHVLGRSDRD